jgi:hypothetical protein
VNELFGFALRDQPFVVARRCPQMQPPIRLTGRPIIIVRIILSDINIYIYIYIYSTLILLERYAVSDAAAG